MGRNGTDLKAPSLPPRKFPPSPMMTTIQEVSHRGERICLGSTHITVANILDLQDICRRSLLGSSIRSFHASTNHDQQLTSVDHDLDSE